MPSSASHGEVGWSLGPWPQMPTYLPCLCRPRSRARSAPSPPGRARRSRAASSSRPESRSRPSVSWVRSLEPIEKPSKYSRNSLGQDGVARHLAHHDDAAGRRAPAALQAVLGQQLGRPRSAWPSVRTKGTMTCTLVRPMSLRTRRSASHSIAKASRELAR